MNRNYLKQDPFQFNEDDLMAMLTGRPIKMADGGPTLNPQQFADFLKLSLNDATNLYSRASDLQGQGIITPSQLASARANMEENQRQYNAALAAIPVTSANLSSNVGAAPMTNALSTRTGPTTMFDEATSTTRSLTGGQAIAAPVTEAKVTDPFATGLAARSTAVPATTGAATSGPATAGPATSATTAATTAATPSLDINKILSSNTFGDNNLTYDQLLTLARGNNLTIDQLAPFIGDETTRAGLVSGLKDYKKSYDAENVETYNPTLINTYAINQAEEAARDGQRVDFSNQNRATQLEAWKRGLYNIPGLVSGGSAAMGAYYGARPVYVTSGITSATQGITSNPLVSTLQTALQNPGGMRENVQAAVRAYQDPTGKVIASPLQIAAADAYVRKLTGDPNATYVRTLRELDERGGGFMYDESRLLGDVKNKLISGLDANLSIAKWDNKTRGEILNQKIKDLNVSPSFAAAALGVSENVINNLIKGDANLWDSLKVNEVIPTRPVREGSSYRYGTAATVSGSNANTALKPAASQPAQTANTITTLPLNITTFASGQVNLPTGFYSLPVSTQVAALNDTKVTAADLRRNGLNQTYVDSLVAAGLKNTG